MTIYLGVFKDYLNKGVFNPKLSNKLFASFLLINFDYLLPYIADFDNIIVLPLLVAETFRSILSVLFRHFKN